MVFSTPRKKLFVFTLLNDLAVLHASGMNISVAVRQHIRRHLQYEVGVLYQMAKPVRDENHGFSSSSFAEML